MTPADWRLLDIAATEDKGAIRRAYATALKAMDVDADPDGFARLRAARDAALARADRIAAGAVEEAEDLVWSDDASDDDDDSFEYSFDDPGFATHAAPPIAEPDIDPERQAFLDTIDAHYRALVQLLFDDDAPPTPQEVDAIAHHGRALLDDPRMEEVGFAASAELWFADNLAATVPRSDPLLEPAAALFGWIDRRNDYALLPGARHVIDRIAATRFAGMLDDPKHMYHGAWVELQRPDGAARRGGVSRANRLMLLQIIRTQYPQVEGWLNPDRVGEAERTGKSFGEFAAKYWLAGILILTVIVRIMGIGTDTEPTTPPPIIPVASPVIPVPPDPRIEAERQRHISAVTYAPDTLLRDAVTWEVKVMRYYQPFDPARCVDAGIWRYDARLSSVWDGQRTALTTAILKHADTSVPHEPSNRFMLSGDIIKAILDRTGFSRERAERALQGTAEVKDVCAVQIALYETALAAPTETGNALIRKLQLAPLG